MSSQVYLSVNGDGVSRAVEQSSGSWCVERLLAGEGVSCLTMTPSAPETVYAGTRRSGILCSDDHGRTWSPCEMAGQAVMSIAVSPHDPEVIYAGTRPAYLYVSRDGARSWEEFEGFRHIPWRWRPCRAPLERYTPD